MDGHGKYTLLKRNPVWGEKMHRSKSKYCQRKKRRLQSNLSKEIFFFLAWNSDSSTSIITLDLKLRTMDQNWSADQDQEPGRGAEEVIP